MEESIKQGKFVNEEEYEWGRNPDDSNYILKKIFSTIFIHSLIISY